jgi:hypothetical protein
MPTLPLFSFLDAGNCLFGTPGPRLSPLDTVDSRWGNPLATKLRVCLILLLLHMMPAKTPAGPKEAARTEAMRVLAPLGI